MGNFLRISGGVARSFAESGSPTIYFEAYNVGSTITAGTAVTLPSAKTYDSAELEVYVNTQRLFPVTDYNYSGSPPRTQVTFTFDLITNDVIWFRIDRGA